VHYIIATSNKLKSELRNHNNFELAKKTKHIEIWKVKNNEGYVAIPKYKPVALVTDDWKKTSLEWFMREDLLDVPLVFLKKKEATRNFEVVDSLDEIEKIPLNVSCNVKEEVYEDRITITTDCIGVPHWIKISYFPNWKVKGAKEIYLASPSFMLVFPEKEKVELYYGETLEDVLGKVLTLIGVFLLIVIKIRENKYSSLNSQTL
jgi:hypothetical protein